MSAVPDTIRHKPRILPSTKAAIIAALGSGMTQSQAAQRFGVHFNSVQRLAKLVRQDSNDANPLKKDWKDTARRKAQQAVERGLDHRPDPIGSANIGLKVLYGIGDLSSDSKVHVDGNVALQVSWLPVQAPTEDAEILSISESDTSAETHDQ